MGDKVTDKTKSMSNDISITVENHTTDFHNIILFQQEPVPGSNKKLLSLAWKVFQLQPKTESITHVGTATYSVSLELSVAKDEVVESGKVPYGKTQIHAKVFYNELWGYLVDPKTGQNMKPVKKNKYSDGTVGCLNSTARKQNIVYSKDHSALFTQKSVDVGDVAEFQLIDNLYVMYNQQF